MRASRRCDHRRRTVSYLASGAASAGRRLTCRARMSLSGYVIFERGLHSFCVKTRSNPDRTPGTTARKVHTLMTLIATPAQSEAQRHESLRSMLPQLADRLTERITTRVD